MWKTGWKVLLVLLLVAVLVSFRSRDTSARKGAEFVRSKEYVSGTCEVVCPVYS